MANKLTKDQKRAKQKKELAAEQQRRKEAESKYRKAVWANVSNDDHQDFAQAHFTAMLQSLAIRAGEPPSEIAPLLKMPAWNMLKQAVQSKIRLLNSVKDMFPDVVETPISSRLFEFWEGNNSPSVCYRSVALLASQPGELPDAMRSIVAEDLKRDTSGKMRYGAFFFGVPLHNPPDYFLAATDGKCTPHLFYATKDRGLIYLGSENETLVLLRFFGRAFRNGPGSEAGVLSVRKQMDQEEEPTPETLTEWAAKLEPVISELGSIMSLETEILCLGAHREMERLEGRNRADREELAKIAAELRERTATLQKTERDLAMTQTKLRGTEARQARSAEKRDGPQSPVPEPPARRALSDRMGDLFGVAPQ